MEYYQYAILFFFGTFTLSMVKDYIEVSYTYQKNKKLS